MLLSPQNVTVNIMSVKKEYILPSIIQDVSISDLNEEENERFRNLIQKIDLICQVRLNSGENAKPY